MLSVSRTNGAPSFGDGVRSCAGVWSVHRVTATLLTVIAWVIGLFSSIFFLMLTTINEMQCLFSLAAQSGRRHEISPCHSTDSNHIQASAPTQ
jgi:hypothetical protein